MSCFEIKTTAVDSVSLIKIDEFVVKITIPQTLAADKRYFSIQAYSGGAIPLEIEGEGYFTDVTGTENLGKTSSVNASSIKTFYLSVGTHLVKVGNKTNVYRLNTTNLTNNVKLSKGTIYSPVLNELYLYGFEGVDVPVDVKTFYVDSILSFVCTGRKSDLSLYGNLSKFSGKTVMTTLDARATNLDGDVSLVSDCVNLERLRLGSSKVSGDVSSLATLTKLTQLDLSACSDVSGTLESFLDGLFSNGRNSGSINVNVGLTNVSYNGELVIVNAYKQFNFNSSGWEEAQ